MKRLAALLILIAGAAKADPLYLPVSADFEVRAYQYAVESSAWNTPTIRLYPFQGSTPIDPSTYSWVYRFGESEYTTSMVTIAGSTGSNYVDFAITGADFSQPCYRWYSAFRAISGTTVVTFARGYLTIANSPEVTAASYIIRTSPTGTTTWVESIVSTDGSVVNRGDSVDQDLSVTAHVAQAVSEALSTSTNLYSNTYTKAQADLKFATGTPVFVESDPLWSASSNLYATTNSLAILSLKHTDATNKLETVFGWGNHATNGYIVQGGNITGRWFAVGNESAGISSFVGGGAGNESVGILSFVGGGNDNLAAETYSTCVGGKNNSAQLAWSAVVGGSDNYAGQYGFVGGGQGNYASGNHSSIAGGLYNHASESYSSVIGGRDNTAGGNWSIAGGYGALATNDGSFVVALPGGSETFGSRGNNSFSVRSVGGAYFLSPNFLIQDTNGSTIAYFSPTGTIVRGPFQIGTNSIHYDAAGNMVATDVWIHVSSATNPLSPARFDQLQAWQASNAPLSAFSAATASLAIAQTTIATLTAQVASLIAQIPALSNYVVASDSTITGLVAAASVSWTSTTAALSSTNAWLFTQVTNRDHTVTTGLQASIAANLATFSTFTNGYAAAITNVDAVTFGGTIKSGFMLASAWEAIRTNVAFAFSGSIAATNTAGTQNYLFYSGTNTWLHDGTSWKWWSRYDF